MEYVGKYKRGKFENNVYAQQQRWVVETYSASWAYIKLEKMCWGGVLTNYIADIC